MKETAPLVEGSDRMNMAIASLLDASPVDFFETTGLKMPARYHECECNLEINTEYSTEQVFAALATEISYARLHDRGMNRDYDREALQFNAESIGFMVCRRYGVDCPMPDTDKVAEAFGYFEADDISKALDSMRQTARNMGDTVEWGIQPRQQEQAKSRNSGYRQYGPR